MVAFVGSLLLALAPPPALGHRGFTPLCNEQVVGFEGPPGPLDSLQGLTFEGLSWGIFRSNGTCATCGCGPCPDPYEGCVPAHGGSNLAVTAVYRTEQANILFSTPPCQVSFSYICAGEVSTLARAYDLNDNIIDTESLTLTRSNQSQPCQWQYSQLTFLHEPGISRVEIFRSDFIGVFFYIDDISYFPRSNNGRVVIGSRNIPLVGVAVEAFEQADPNITVATSLTDDNGYYGFCGLEGEYGVRARMPGPPGGAPFIINYPSDRNSSEYSFAPGEQTIIPDIRYPNPILLQGGLWGSDSTWSDLIGFFALDQRLSSIKSTLRLPAFHCFPHLGYLNGGLDVRHHDQNAAFLEAFAAASLSYYFPYIPVGTGADLEFDVVCHSMGALITRAMTYKQTFIPIRKIVSLDGVHGGSTRAFYTSLRGINPYDLNGLFDNSGGLLIAGWNQVRRDYKHEWLTYQCSEPVFDVVLPDESALGFGQAYKEQNGSAPVPFMEPQRFINRPHEACVGNSHGDIHDAPDRLQEIAAYLVRSEIPGASCPQPITIQDVGQPGHLAFRLQPAPGSTETRQFSIDSNLAAAIIMLVRGPASISMRDCTGSSVFPTGTVVLDDDAHIRHYTLASPCFGTWEIEVGAGISAASDILVDVQYENGRFLSRSFTPPSISSASAVHILVNLAEGDGAVITADSYTFSGVVTRPDGVDTVLSFVDDGIGDNGIADDGVFGAYYSSTSVAGIYPTSITGQVSLAGEVVERSDVAQLFVRPSGLEFVGIPLETVEDVDGDGLHDSLVITHNLEATRPGSFVVLGELADASGDVFSGLNQPLEVVDSGLETIMFNVPAADIARHAVDGPWVLHMSVSDSEASGMTVSSAPSWLTQAWEVVAFETPPLPVIDLVEPNEGPRSGGLQVFLFGSNLTDVSGVSIGGTHAAFVINDDHSLIVDLPRRRHAPVRGLGANRIVAEPVSVRLETPWGSIVLDDAFTYR